MFTFLMLRLSSIRLFGWLLPMPICPSRPSSSLRQLNWSGNLFSRPYVRRHVKCRMDCCWLVHANLTFSVPNTRVITSTFRNIEKAVPASFETALRYFSRHLPPPSTRWSTSSQMSLTRSLRLIDAFVVHQSRPGSGFPTRRSLQNVNIVILSVSGSPHTYIGNLFTKHLLKYMLFRLRCKLGMTFFFKFKLQSRNMFANGRRKIESQTAHQHDGNLILCCV